MKPDAARADEAIGVECAWPARKAAVAQQQASPRGGSRLGRRAWRALAVLGLVGLLGVGGWSLTNSAIDISTVLPSMPAQSD